MMKKCSICQEIKAIEKFYIMRQSKDGRQPCCAKCCIIKGRIRKNMENGKHEAMAKRIDKLESAMIKLTRMVMNETADGKTT